MEGREKMVKLFNEDKDCMSAAGLPISIYSDNSIGEEELINRTINLRPFYPASATGFPQC